GYKAQDWAFELQKADNDLFDRRIMDNARCIEGHLINNDKWRVDVRQDKDGDGEIKDEELESVKLLDAIVDSFDSELDLYIEKQLQDIIATYGPNCMYNLKAIFGNPKSPASLELARLGIRMDGIGDHDLWQNRTYSFSLIDMSGLPEDATDDELLAYLYSEDATILEDANGKKGSMIFADCLTADGTAQGAELNLSSILDQMGYECVSKADFIDDPEAYHKLISDIETNLQNKAYKSSGETINDKYGETLTGAQAVCAVYRINGDAPGMWDLGRNFQQTKERVDAAGNNLFKDGGYAKKGAAVDYGKSQHKPADNSLADGTDDVTKEEMDAQVKEQEQKEEQIKAKEEKEKIQQEQEQAQYKEEQQAQVTASANNAKAMNSAMDEYFAYVDEVQKTGEEFDKNAIIEKYAKEYGVDKEDLEYAILKND
ncbi:MAG: hypothetical protein IJW73_05950, partial [Candidatus Gastranaerophilales bacterium]|nr:hypothetical protein [Candidatus Gastranaerophilales bacterium]